MRQVGCLGIAFCGSLLLLLLCATALSIVAAAEPSSSVVGPLFRVNFTGFKASATRLDFNAVLSTAAVVSAISHVRPSVGWIVGGAAGGGGSPNTQEAPSDTAVLAQLSACATQPVSRCFALVFTGVADDEVEVGELWTSKGKGGPEMEPAGPNARGGSVDTDPTGVFVFTPSPRTGPSGDPVNGAVVHFEFDLVFGSSNVVVASVAATLSLVNRPPVAMSTSFFAILRAPPPKARPGGASDDGVGPSDPSSSQSAQGGDSNVEGSSSRSEAGSAASASGTLVDAALRNEVVLPQLAFDDPDDDASGILSSELDDTFVVVDGPCCGVQLTFRQVGGDDSYGEGEPPRNETVLVFPVNASTPGALNASSVGTLVAGFRFYVTDADEAQSAVASATVVAFPSEKAAFEATNTSVFVDAPRVFCGPALGAEAATATPCVVRILVSSPWAPFPVSDGGAGDPDVGATVDVVVRVNPTRGRLLRMTSANIGSDDPAPPTVTSAGSTFEFYYLPPTSESDSFTAVATVEARLHRSGHRIAAANGTVVIEWNSVPRLECTTFGVTSVPSAAGVRSVVPAFATRITGSVPASTAFVAAGVAPSPPTLAPPTAPSTFASSNSVQFPLPVLFEVVEVDSQFQPWFHRQLQRALIPGDVVRESDIEWQPARPLGLTDAAAVARAARMTLHAVWLPPFATTGATLGMCSLVGPPTEAEKTGLVVVDTKRSGRESSDDDPTVDSARSDGVDAPFRLSTTDHAADCGRNGGESTAGGAAATTGFRLVPTATGQLFRTFIQHRSAVVIGTVASHYDVPRLTFPRPCATADATEARLHSTSRTTTSQWPALARAAIDRATTSDYAFIPSYLPSAPFHRVGFTAAPAAAAKNERVTVDFTRLSNAAPTIRRAAPSCGVSTKGAPFVEVGRNADTEAIYEESVAYGHNMTVWIKGEDTDLDSLALLVQRPPEWGPWRVANRAPGTLYVPLAGDWPCVSVTIVAPPARKSRLSLDVDTVRLVLSDGRDVSRALEFRVTYMGSTADQLPLRASRLAKLPFAIMAVVMALLAALFCLRSRLATTIGAERAASQDPAAVSPAAPAATAGGDTATVDPPGTVERPAGVRGRGARRGFSAIRMSDPDAADDDDDENEMLQIHPSAKED